MIDLEFLQALIRAVDDSGIDSVEVSRGSTRVRIAKTPTQVNGPVQTAAAPSAPVPPQNPPQSQSEPRAEPEDREEKAAAAARSAGLVDVTSPMVGTFYRAPAPEAPAYVEIGSRVSKGQTLCILEAMKLMNELEAEVEGVVREICIENAEPVEYGQVLFRIDPEG